MFLDAIASRNIKETYRGLNTDTGLFDGQKLVARMAPTDRFLSIYNRPTRMRQVFTKPNTKLPASLVVQHSTTKDIYILGTQRQDTKFNVNNGKPYVEITMAHLVTPNGQGTSGLFKVYRKLLPDLSKYDDFDDMKSVDYAGRDIYQDGNGKVFGWLEDTKVMDAYGDVEFRTTKAEAGTFDHREGDYYGWFAINARLQDFDKLVLDGRTYFVAMEYSDLGFTGVTLSHRLERYQDFKFITTERTYNSATHEYDTTAVEKEVSGIITDDTEKVAWATGAVSNIQIAINTDHIGFTPKIGEYVKYQGRERKIKSVYLQAAQVQWLVVCE
jgi:hypothetical protein